LDAEESFFEPSLSSVIQNSKSNIAAQRHLFPFKIQNSKFNISMSPVIRVENLGKKYLLRHQQQGPRYKTLRDVLTGKAKGLFGNSKSKIQNSKSVEEFWALKDVNFEIQQGEAVGIIGRNGAGKSTLLKLLSRITQPTTGRMELEGRVASLLEVGTGFHPELTGRENIYLNGAILGMGRAEIKSKFDEIVAFSEVEKFLDTPVKRYSSGMYMRLAFAVAAHLDPDILIIDEVLAVGDAQFQERCLNKMDQTTASGRTVIFVSHNMNAVQRLCLKCIQLSNGRVVASGHPDKVIRQYLETSAQGFEWKNDENSHANAYFQPMRLAVINSKRETATTEMRGDEQVGILIEGMSESRDSSLVVGFALYAEDNSLLFWSLQTDTATDSWPEIRKGKNVLVCWLPEHLLNEGDYRIELIVSLHCRSWICQPGVSSPAVSLRIRGGLSDSPHWLAARPGLLGPVLPFYDAL
jgi:lipopolysaccharide transport system ATP-binding protein